MTFSAFKHIFSKQDTSQMAGPLMIISATAKGAEQGVKIFFIFLAIISINLAILNLIPLPILDGGQILFYTIEAIIRRPLPETVKYYIHLASWIGILILMLYLSLKDITRIFCK
jgi:regulator of sigma E protease